jgi:hypothetical protein
MFIKDRDDALILLHKTEAEFLICGYINRLCDWQQQKSNLIINNIKSVANDQFATIIQSNSIVAIENIFMDNSRINLYSIFP